MTIYSTSEQLSRIQNILSLYIRLPFSGKTIPGAIMEAVLANVLGGEVLNTYDFVDVIKPESHCGWQIKSTKAKTPVTWKRAKIPNAVKLIKESRDSVDGCQALGDEIINFCNAHVQESIELYNLNEVGYCRLIIFDNGDVCYFERLLCTKDNPLLFNPEDFTWRWSVQKNVIKKEQLSALHGIHKPTGKKWWAWHGLGENQLHFSGEKVWWPKDDDPHQTAFCLPNVQEKMSLEDFMQLLVKMA